MTTFDCLNTELLLEIFDYLSFTDLFRAFFNLQQCINDVIRAYPACIDLSKATDRNALIHGPFLCRALIASDDDSQENHMNQLNLNFEAIRAFEFKYGNFTILQSLVQQLPMKQLESIIIEKLHRANDPKDIDQQIWSTIAIAGRNGLRYLRTSLRIIRWDVEQLLFDLPILQYVILNYISAKEMLAFVRHTPNLYSFTGRVTAWNIDNYASDFSLFTLTQLNLYIECCSSFKELRQLLSVCPCLTHFILRFWITGNNVIMVNATEWQTLVEQCLPCLVYLKIRLFRYETINNEPDFQETFNLSEYWLRRQPQFDIQV
ncbi:unnamed protein product [Rotaria sp. Silwood2]|nr:unnamed protein product [Rotaria sp. Silwood2]CAF3019708.1 unnamed protein product [Rotaria sp. Silwood2]CAF3418727.1 unnamed protein product [Rotaria sp. Silwood2]CAF4026211.1 unnamed protein product [Rotaria sp. Silwood2]CAF4458819.1 unnamed protein product [Rotaria sp. Silwood2]